MALRQVESIVINGTEYTTLKMDDPTVLIGSTGKLPLKQNEGGYGAPSNIASYGTDFKSTLFQNSFDSALSYDIESSPSGTKLQKDASHYESTLGVMVSCLYISVPGSDYDFTDCVDPQQRDWARVHTYFGIVLDDENEVGWIVCELDCDGYTFYYSQGQDGDKIYNAFKGGASTTSNGGGATHIAKVTGQLKDLSSNLSDILIVSGGGGGGYLVGETAYAGKDAGGISGSGDNSGNQSTGYGFGQGESGSNVSGGGAGLYGGYKGTSSKGGGAGSGYIGNSLLESKKMVGFNVPTSSDASTKTESANIYSATKLANTPKAGDGWARIKCLSAFEPENITTWDKVSGMNMEVTYENGVNHILGYGNQTWEYWWKQFSVVSGAQYRVTCQVRSDFATSYFNTTDRIYMMEEAYSPPYDPLSRSFAYGDGWPGVTYTYSDYTFTFTAPASTVYMCLGFGNVWTGSKVDFYIKNLRIERI